MTQYYADLAACTHEAGINGWRHRLEQYFRFEIVQRGLDIGPKTAVVDLGCGTGCLLEYLGLRRPGGYLGVDRLKASIDRARQKARAAHFLCADLYDESIDSRGPFDVAVAIGTVVDGEVRNSRSERMAHLDRLMGRLDELGAKGWALVVLNDEMLADEPARTLERCLRGATRQQVARLLAGRGLEAVVDHRLLPSDLFVICRRGEPTNTVRRRMVNDSPHRRAVEFAARDGEALDPADVVSFWIQCGKFEEASRELKSLSPRHPRRHLLAERLKLLTP